jgi:putative FmdB family regulatory protein
MPVYEYRCPDCGYEFESEHAMSEHVDPEECPECQSDLVHRVFSSFGVQYKGMGFYSTDTGRN